MIADSRWGLDWMAARVDTLIVGGGSAGCVLAARLSDDPARRVVLLEAGPDYPDVTTAPDVVRLAHGGLQAVDQLADAGLGLRGGRFGDGPADRRAARTGHGRFGRHQRHHLPAWHARGLRVLGESWSDPNGPGTRSRRRTGRSRRTRSGLTRIMAVRGRCPSSTGPRRAGSRPRPRSTKRARRWATARPTTTTRPMRWAWARCHSISSRARASAPPSRSSRPRSALGRT